MISSPEDVGVPIGTPGWIGAAVAAVVAAALGMRRWLSGDASSRAENSANIEFLNTLMAQLERANARADAAERERNEAIATVGELKAQIATLQYTVNHLQAQITRMEEKVCPT